ncbi:glycosyltransferase family 2 protein [Roseisalinus antarcticus]|uniref:Glycosyl transferase family 2 n=1 Tax=Roseisalinus antarcticus TaxID=254357 RepID=A0A1Y5T9J3_9RHOB|nr:glycosyltransferase family 2 protein [Roseisalinus antarcticus]SLN55338.1 hypothetical protein ROA7023_02515 [Roseisalinus antarcticus]
MSPRHTYTILSMMKDEGHSLVEWVAYHRHIGFDNICVYTNNCSDGTDDMLIRLEELGWVRHFRNEVPEDKKPQPNALSLATENPEVMNSEWVLVMDADEFLSVKCGRGWITDLVERIPPEAQAMAITWRFFGSSGLTEWNPGLVIENYTKAAPDKFKKGWGVKTLFKPFPEIKLGIHRPTIKKARQSAENAKILFDQLWLNGSGEPMPDEFSLSGWRSTKPTLGYKLAELNHYATKSLEAYLLRRVRGNVNNKEDKYNAAYFALFDRNEIDATNALRHAKAVKKKMAEILSDPVMRKLQDEALAFHEARVATLRSTGEYDHWLAELKQASETTIDQLDEVLFVQHLPKKWQEKVKEMQAQGVPDKTIAKMIAATQTAKKGETRSALLEAAGVKTPDTPPDETAQARDSATEVAMSLDNPFLNTPEAAALGVPRLQPNSAKVSLDIPAPALDTIVEEATVSASNGISSDPGIIAPVPGPEAEAAVEPEALPEAARKTGS